MQLSDKSGIGCDHCGTIHNNDFTYYSFDFRLVSVFDNRRPPLDHIYSDPVIFSLDICPACFASISAEVVKNYSKIMSPQRKVRVDTVCEMSGKSMVGTYNYYHVDVTKVVVKTTGQPRICRKCKAKTFEFDKVCACQNNTFVCAASVSPTSRFVEINLCEDVYKTLTNIAAKTRQVAGQWSTKS